jgi:hypothetical protein
MHRGIQAMVGRGSRVTERLSGESIRRDRQKRLAQLAAWPCPGCGAPFGAETADAARKEGERQVAEAMKDAMGRGIQLRVVML